MNDFLSHPAVTREQHARGGDHGSITGSGSRVGWSSKRYWSPGYRLDEDLPQFPEVAGTRHDSNRYRCLLNDGHDGRHIGGCVDQHGDAIYEWARS